MAGVDKVYVTLRKEIFFPAVNWVWQANERCKTVTGRKLLDYLQYRLHNHECMKPGEELYERLQAEEEGDSFAVLNYLPQRIEEWVIFRAIKPNAAIKKALMRKYELTRLLHGESCSDDWDRMRSRLKIGDISYLEYLESQNELGG